MFNIKRYGLCVKAKGNPRVAIILHGLDGHKKRASATI